MELTLRRLTPEDIGMVRAIEQATFPPEYFTDLTKFYETLVVPHIKGHNYSVGVFDGEQLVGYVLMHVQPSEFIPGERAAYVLDLAVLFKYRRAAVIPLIRWIINEATLCGMCIEAKMRERTSYRMIMRNWQLISQGKYRITSMYETEPTGSERNIQVRFERVVAGGRLEQRLDAALSRAERAVRAARMLPCRLLRRMCYHLPPHALPLAIRRSTFLRTPEELHTMVSDANRLAA